MSNKNTLAQGVVIGAVIGAAAGILGSACYHARRQLSPDDILNQIKRSFLKEGPIEGSWISFETKPQQKFAIKMDVVEGGITRIEDGSLVSYEFVADAKTGAVLSMERFAHLIHSPYDYE